jgi:hypothetical protein
MVLYLNLFKEKRILMNNVNIYIYNMHIVCISINYDSFVFRKIWHNMIG